MFIPPSTNSYFTQGHFIVVGEWGGLAMHESRLMLGCDKKCLISSAFSILRARQAPIDEPTFIKKG